MSARSFFEEPQPQRLHLRGGSGTNLTLHAATSAANRRSSLPEQQSSAAANSAPVPQPRTERTLSTASEVPCAVSAIEAAARAVRERREQQAKDPNAAAFEQQQAEELRAQYKELMRFVPDLSLSERMMKLRKLVLTKGIPPETPEERAKRDAANDPSVQDVCTLRGTIWKVLLGAFHMDAVHYMHIISEGPTWMDHKIRNDTFRTFQGDEDYWRRVTESHMARVLNAYVRLNASPPDNPTGGDSSPGEGAKPSPTLGQPGDGYVQGMNVLAGPFLYVMPEVDAFVCFNQLLTKHMPRYVLKNMEGAHNACSLVEKLLEHLDPELSTHLLHRNKISATVYAFPMVVTLMGMFRPLSSVLRVWDAIFAFGVHFGVVLVATQIILMRDTLFDSSPMKHLLPRTLGQLPLDAEVLIAAALAAVKHVPQSLFEDIVRHPVERPTDPTSMLSTSKRTDDRPGSADGARTAGKRSKDDHAPELAPRPKPAAPRNRAMSPVPPKMAAGRGPSTSRPARPKKIASTHSPGRDAAAEEAAKLKARTLNPSRLFEHTMASRNRAPSQKKA